MSVLADSAIAYAQTEGLYVFPLQVKGKIPLTAHGLDDATIDALTIETWWSRWPEANIAIRTGDLVVVDEDRPGALDDLARKHEENLPETRIARTGKGRHYYFTQPPGLRIRNTAGKLAPGVDTRGDGGYVVAPPSVHPEGGVYTWESTAPPAQLPSWIAELLAKPEPKEREPFLGRSTPYGQRALEAEMHAVATASEGTRNDRLNTAAFSLGQLIAGGELDEQDARASLHAAARACGLPDREAEQTINSGLEAGLLEPRSAPENGPRPTSLHVVRESNSDPAAPVEVEPIVFETLRAFLARDIPRAEALIGVTRDGTNLLPRYGWVMPWGREGSGKTSILVDLIFHACAGIDWLSYPVGRQLRIIAIVNEGIPGGLQDKLQQKVERWEHDKDLVLDNLAIYSSPWGEFTFRDQRMVDHARSFTVDFGADYVALDPLHTLGTQGAGAPAETEEFKHLLRAFGLWDDLGVITAHHSNKAGMLSGDWGRHVDTMFHLEKEGKQPATKLTLQKARPADPNELGVPYLLRWLTDSLGFERHDLQTTTSFNEAEALEKARQVLADARAPLGKDAFVKAVGGTAEQVRQAVDKWLRDGQIVDLTPEKRSFKLVLPDSTDEAPTEPDGTTSEGGQTRMAMPSTSVGHNSTQRDATEEQPAGASSVGRRPPYRGETEDDGTERAETESTGDSSDDDIDFG